MATSRPSFRPDLEGLRGVAILLVVLYHAGVPWLSGGFVGVDVFFVLSGYFITGLLVAESDRTGTVDVAAFLGRRAMRLVPTLIVVLLATLALVLWLWAPIDRAPVASAARAAALSSSNIEFARQSVDYFSSRENPLLHTWSLGVEEQLYFVWPLLFLAAALVHDRHPVGTEGDAGRSPLLAWIAVCGALSFAASLWLTHAAQPWAFFGMPTRIWEFALGGAVAVTWSGSASLDARGAWIQGASLATIAVAVATYDRATPYPGVAALLPALAAVGLIVGGILAPAGVTARVLGASPLRWLGRVSYAWYLWHWPLVGLGAVLHPALGVAGRLAWSLAALSLAWLTWRLVEQPARDGWLSRMPPARAATATLAASLACALVAHLALRASERGVASGVQRAYAAARVDRMAKSCWVTTLDAVAGPCELGDLSSTTTLALLGDSHAEHWLAGLDAAGRARGWKIDAMVKGGCPVADMPELVTPRLRRHYHECARYREAMLQRIVAMRPTAVILSSWDHYMPADGSRSDWQVTPAMWERGLRRTYARLAAAGIRVVVMRDTPKLPFDAPGCLSRRAARLPLAGPCEYQRAGSRSALALRAQDAAARGLPVRFIDMNDAVCATRTCGVVSLRHLVIFTDDNHLTASFTRSVAPVLGERVARAIAR